MLEQGSISCEARCAAGPQVMEMTELGRGKAESKLWWEQVMAHQLALPAPLLQAVVMPVQDSWPLKCFLRRAT